MKLEVGMYVRGKYYQYGGKIGKIIKNYNNDLEIAYKDSILKTNVGSFIDDNYDINGKQYKASYDIIDILEKGDCVNGNEIGYIDDCKGAMRQFYYDYENPNDDVGHWQEEIKTIITHEQMKEMAYEVGE